MATLIDDVTFDINLKPEEIGADTLFPPRRFDVRDERFTALHNLWRGDFSDYEIKYQVAINYFHSYSTKLANLLLMVKPLLGEAPLTEPMYDAVIDMTRYGGAILAWDGANLSTYDPMTWYPLSSDGSVEGHAFVRRYISIEADSAAYDRVNVITIIGNEKISYDYEWSNGRIGNLLDEETLEDTEVAIVPRLPSNGIWGTAKYIELCDPIVEIVRRTSSNRRLLDLYTGPMPVYKQSTLDAETRFGVTVDDTPGEAHDKITKGLFNLLEAGVLSVEDIVADVSFLQPSVAGINQALAHVQEMKEALSSLTGMPSLSGPHQPPPSGEALKRVLLHFYAESSALQESLVEKASELVGNEIVWPHIFDVLESQTADQEAQLMQMITDQENQEEQEETEVVE